MKIRTLPKGSPDPLPELAAYVEPFAPLFRRSTSRTYLERYVTGRLSDLPRKNCEARAQAVANTQLGTIAPCGDRCGLGSAGPGRTTGAPVGGAQPSECASWCWMTLACPSKAWVGVQQQYSGTLGKQGNCQIAFLAQYVVDDPSISQPLHWPSSARLYLPAAWTQDRVRGHSCRVPQEVTFATKPELALQLLDRAQAWGVPFAIVVTDADYGSPSFLRALDERHLPYVCAVASDFGVRLPSRMQQAAASQAALAKGQRGQPKQPRPASLHDLKGVTDALPEVAWQTVQWREGTPGTDVAGHLSPCGFTRAWAVLATAKHMDAVGPGLKAGCLVNAPFLERKAIPSGFGVGLPADTPLVRLVELAHLRWPGEQFYEDAQGECGLDHSQRRRWHGLHRHLALVMLAYTFLMLQSVGQEIQTDPAPGGVFPPVRRISLPACHRLVLLLLFQDVVLWLIETEQVKVFRPRRN
jgi:SRSO17 transposase